MTIGKQQSVLSFFKRELQSSSSLPPSHHQEEEKKKGGIEEKTKAQGEKKEEKENGKIKMEIKETNMKENIKSSIAHVNGNNILLKEKDLIISKVESSQQSISSPSASASIPSSSPSLELRGHGPSSEDCLAFMTLCKTFEKIEATTKRLEIADILTDLFDKIIKSKCSNDLVIVIYLCLSRLGPVYEANELGLGEALLIKVISGTSGKSSSVIKKEIESSGDIGIVAQTSRSSQTTIIKSKSLTVSTLFKTLMEISQTTGQSAVGKKIEKVQGLYSACKELESRYLFRLLEGKLRIGLAEQTLLAALANASIRNHPIQDQKSRNQELKSKLEMKKDSLQGKKVKEKEKEKEREKKKKREKEKQRELEESENDDDSIDHISIIKTVYNTMPNYERIVPNLLEYGIENLEKMCKITPGIPLKPMLAFPTKSVVEVLDRFENLSFTCEYKYDGERAQIHRTKEGNIYIYSRNSENILPKYPDLIEKIEKSTLPGTGSYILDCEVVAWNVKDGKILPFQILSTRKRKDVTDRNINVQVILFAFDLLYLNGESLIECEFQKRREMMHSSFQSIDGQFNFVTYMNASTIEEIQTFLEDAVHNDCEGLMVKTLNEESSYEPSKRSRKWLKVKKDYLDGVGDSLDLVVIGGYAGRGKRKGVYGGYLLACYDPSREQYQSICKIGTGFSEQDLETQMDFFKDHIIPHPKSYFNCSDAIKPDVWFEPVMVWEIKAADFSISPIYSAAIDQIEADKGISLRFPRYIRTRDDKGPEDISTSDQIAEMYKSQMMEKGNIADKNNDFNNQDSLEEM